MQLQVSNDTILTDTIISSSTSYYIAIDVKVGEGERLVGTKVAHDNLCLGYQVSIVVSIVIGINYQCYDFYLPEFVMNNTMQLIHFMIA